MKKNIYADQAKIQEKSFQRMIAYQKKIEMMVTHKRMNRHMTRKG